MPRNRRGIAPLRPYVTHSIEELEELVKSHMHSRAVLGDIRNELTYHKKHRAKALLRDVTALLTGQVEMPARPRRPDSPDNQLAFLGGSGMGAGTRQRHCMCCEAEISFARPRICPKCNHRFAGNGWDGVDAHWRSKHEHEVPYAVFWETLCPAHRE